MLPLKESRILSIVFIFVVSFSINSETFGQYSSEDGSPPSNHSQIVLSKVATGNTIIANKTSFVGGFDTTYSIIGNIKDIQDSKVLIIKSMIDDFSKSPTVGYVKVSKSISNSTGTQITNPFASDEQIKLKIQDLLSKSIDSVTDSSIELLELKCFFGNSLDLFSCSVYSSLG